MVSLRTAGLLIREGVDGFVTSFFFFGSAVDDCDALCNCILEALGFCNPEVVGNRLMFARFDGFGSVGGFIFSILSFFTSF